MPTRGNYVAKSRFWRHNSSFGELRRLRLPDGVGTIVLAQTQIGATLCRDTMNSGGDAGDIIIAYAIVLKDAA
jgi:hypothetical protein